MQFGTEFVGQQLSIYRRANVITNVSRLLVAVAVFACISLSGFLILVYQPNMTSDRSYFALNDVATCICLGVFQTLNVYMQCLTWAMVGAIVPSRVVQPGRCSLRCVLALSDAVFGRPKLHAFCCAPTDPRRLRVPAQTPSLLPNPTTKPQASVLMACSQQIAIWAAVGFSRLLIPSLDEIKNL